MKKFTLLPRAAAAASLLAPGILTAQGQPAQRPNVLFLFLDDMTYDGIHALGNPGIITPNLDRLVREGTSFMNTYNMGGWHGAISVASRSQLITGRYLWNTYAVEQQGYADPLERGEFWVQQMSRAGYRTYMSGKWHVSGPHPEKLFDRAEDVRPGGMPKDTPDAYNRPQSPADTVWRPWDTSKGGYWEGGKHWSEALADNAVNYLRQQEGSSDPLFLYLAFNAPHDPRQAPREYVEMYDVEKIEVPKSFLTEHPHSEPMGTGRDMRDERLAPFPRTEYSIQKHRQEYYALITHLDAQIGRILEALRESGMEENTLIVVAGDNGLSVGQHGLLGKQSMYEHSMRVPLVFSGYGVPKNQKRYCLNYMQDLVPTVYDIAGIETPDYVEFESLLPAMRDRRAASRETIYGAFTRDNQRMIRSQRYKLVFIPQARVAYLFDLKKDPEEMHNLYGDKKYDPVVRRLGARYLRLAAELNDPLDIAPLYPDIF